jgi:hypothetical protein
MTSATCFVVAATGAVAGAACSSLGRLGAGWAGCDCYPDFYAGFERDYGTPVKASYGESSAGSGVFVREWTKADVRFDCNTGKANITMK